jgi:uncharacterized repeat protein (TIGR03803 family)
MTTNELFRWTFSFNGTNGYYPSSIITGSDGNLYGTTFGNQTSLLYNNPPFPINFGGVFCMSTDGELLWVFPFSGANGNAPAPSLLQAADGYLYGTTLAGGEDNQGTIFRIAPSGTDFTSIYSFTGGADGGTPDCGLVQLSDGGFYGVASAGGNSNAGTLFRLDLPAALGAPALQSAVVANGGIFLTWTTLPNRTYQLQYSDDLSAGSWTYVGPPIVASAAFTLFNDAAATNSQGFYRLARQ